MQDTEYASPFSNFTRWQRWIFVGINAFFVVAGLCVGNLLGRFYYDQGGKSKWMATFVQSAGFPILWLPLLLFSPSRGARIEASSSKWKVGLMYLILGAITAGDNWLYSIGLLYLSVSTYSLICTSQLAFTAITSYFLNSQKFTFPIISSVVVLTASAALIGLDEDANRPDGVSQGKYIFGFVCTIAASALYALLLSLIQVTFERVIKKETFKVVLDMQIYPSLVATCLTLVGLFASGEWKTLHGEMRTFRKGTAAYVLTLVFAAVSWQLCSLGLVGLIFVVSSLFSNVVSTVALVVSPVAAVIVFHDKMNGAKGVAMFLAVYGFVCYGYHNYLDDDKKKKLKSGDPDTVGGLARVQLV